jgi:poly(3-hydroxybutyrate) depolymerase
VFNFLPNVSLYTLIDMYRDLQAPVHELIGSSLDFYANGGVPISSTAFGQDIIDRLKTLHSLQLTHTKPEFGIRHTLIDGHKVEIKQKICESRAFCDLLHFEKAKKSKPQPKLLIFAPMAGHYATLLRGTVQALLPHCDVYITDWKNARDVPLSDGGFDLDDYISYAIDFIRKLGPEVHVFAVCQPTVPVLAAIALMSAKGETTLPRSMILMGGPIDPRKSPTQVNELAIKQSEDWFTQNLISIVPAKHPGAMRAVYPGHLQLFGFLAMNMPRHLDSAAQLYRNITLGNKDSGKKIADFYKEYFSVMDLTAEFYMQTISTVFKQFALPEGTMTSRGHPVNLKSITNVRLLAIEGEKDDIAGVGQTRAAIELCTNIQAKDKHYYLQKDVGHYGLFNGGRFREEVVPVIMEFITHDKK